MYQIAFFICPVMNGRRMFPNIFSNLILLNYCIYRATYNNSVAKLASSLLSPFCNVICA